jgi:ribosomal protein S18 acetylase RimI-like enzyme
MCPADIAPAGDRDVPEVRALFLDYARALGFSLCFQGFDAELAGLPGAYAPPRGCLLLARHGREAAGCVGLRPLEDGTAEIKRLYVRPARRGGGLGRRLAEAALAEAARLGYPAVRLDTTASMTAARALYASLGFVPVAPYYPDPRPGIDCFEKRLAPAAASGPIA